MTLKCFTVSEEVMLLGREFHNEGVTILNSLSLYVVVFDLGTCSRFADKDLSSLGGL